MSDLKYSILETLYMCEFREKPYTDLMNDYLAKHLLNEASLALKDLSEDDLVIIEKSSNNVKLTKLGRTIYESVKEERQYQLECKQRELDAEQRARDSDALTRRSIRITKIANAIAIGSIIVTILSCTITIFQTFIR